MAKKKIDWEQRCKDLLEEYISMYGFGDSVLHHVKFSTFGIEKKQRWFDIYRDGRWWTFNCDTWEELHQELWLVIQGIVIAEGSYQKCETLIKEEISTRNIGREEARIIVKERIKNGDY